MTLGTGILHKGNRFFSVYLSAGALCFRNCRTRLIFRLPELEHRQSVPFGQFGRRSVTKGDHVPALMIAVQLHAAAQIDQLQVAVQADTEHTGSGSLLGFDGQGNHGGILVMLIAANLLQRMQVAGGCILPGQHRDGFHFAVQLWQRRCACSCTCVSSRISGNVVIARYGANPQHCDFSHSTVPPTQAQKIRLVPAAGVVQ